MIRCDRCQTDLNYAEWVAHRQTCPVPQAPSGTITPKNAIQPCTVGEPRSEVYTAPDNKYMVSLTPHYIQSKQVDVVIPLRSPVAQDMYIVAVTTERGALPFTLTKHNCGHPALWDPVLINALPLMAQKMCPMCLLAALRDVPEVRAYLEAH